MNDFSKHMGDSFAFARANMGDTVVLNGIEVTAVTIRMGKSSAAAERGGGRVVSITGEIEVSLDDWRNSGARQGSVIVHPFHGDMKITNTPNEAYSVVRLEVAGRAQ